MQIKFYYAAGANCCDRVRWALDYKRMSYELVDIDSPHDARHLHSISPYGRVPVMELDGTALTESMAMVELLEELAPSSPLNYATALARAQVREVCEAVNSSIHPAQNSSIVRYFRPDLSKDEMRPIRANWIASNLVKLQTRLWQSSEFAVGQKFTIADIFVATIFRKGVELGMQTGAFGPFETHWKFLMLQSAIRMSCPLPEARNPLA